VEKTTVVPSSDRNTHRRSRWRGSSDAEGSSSSSTSGWPSRPIAMFTRWRLPPESRLTSSPARSASAVCSSIRATVLSTSGTRSRRAKSRRFSATDSFEYSAGCCGTQPACSGRSDTQPDVGSSAPARICSSVVLPAPFGPMIATRSPAATSNETERSASRVP
jgi:hypothetical protein